MSGPSLPTERTDLAWRRTVLTAAVTGLLAGRAAVLSWPGPLATAAVVVLAAAVGVIAVVSRRRGEVLTGPPVRIASGRVWLPTAAVLAIAALGLAAVLSP